MCVCECVCVESYLLIYSKRKGNFSKTKIKLKKKVFF